MSIIDTQLEGSLRNPKLPSESVTDSAVVKNLNQYNIEQYRFPEDAGVSPDLKHTIAFFINVRGNSKSNRTLKTNFKITDEQVLTRAGVVGAIGVGTAGAVGSTVLNTTSSAAKAAVNSIAGAGLNHRTVGGVPNPLSAATSAAGAAATEVLQGAKVAGKTAGAGVVVGATALGFGQTEMHRLAAALVLAIQEPPKVSYSVGYETFDAGTLMGGMSSGDASVISAGGAGAGILKFMKIPGVLGAPDFGKGIQKVSGTALNPFKTALFKEVKLRTFEFNYKFMPKSQKEALNVRNIIYALKYHMHPEFDTNKIFLIHPSEFNIVYYYAGKENDNWNKIGTCVLTDMQLDQGTEQLTSFIDGSSVEINMKLTFMETEMITKEKIEKGY